MSFLAGKTPVSYLQEICVKRCITPEYSLIASEGTEFVYRVKCGEYITTGRGVSKKKAKHNAALNALNTIMKVPITADIDPNYECNMNNLSINDVKETNLSKENMPSEKNENENNSNSASNFLKLANPKSEKLLQQYPESLGSINPVGELQEISQKNLWPPPIYDNVGEEGPPHKKEFVCTVRLCKVLQRGTGKSKKIAKRNAAEILLKGIQSGAITIDPSDNNNKENTVADSANNYAMLKTNNSCPPIQPEMSKKITKFYQNMRDTTGEQLNSLQKQQLNSVDLQYVNMLRDIGLEQRFDITYVNLDEKGYDGHFQVLLQLSTMPVAVVHGSGISFEQARSQAAHNALQYLKIMTKKA